MEKFTIEIVKDYINGTIENNKLHGWCIIKSAILSEILGKMDINHTIRSKNPFGGYLLTAAILSEFLTRYKVEHEVVDGYLICNVGEGYYTRYVWVEVKYENGRVKAYHPFNGFGYSKWRFEPYHLEMLQETKEEKRDLRELSSWINVFKKDRRKYYKILRDNDNNGVLKQSLKTISTFACCMGYPVDLNSIIMTE